MICFDVIGTWVFFGLTFSGLIILGAIAVGATKELRLYRQRQTQISPIELAAPNTEV